MNLIVPSSEAGQRIVDFLRVELQIPRAVQWFEVRFAMDEAVTVKCEYMPEEKGAE
jgi:hypothetical protein